MMTPDEQLEQLIETEDYETPEQRNWRLNQEYEDTGIIFLDEDAMIELAKMGEEYYE